MVVMRTYVEYIPVAEFVTEVDKSEIIKEALNIIKSWNPDWWPGEIMLDYSEAKAVLLRQSLNLPKSYFVLFTENKLVSDMLEVVLFIHFNY